MRPWSTLSPRERDGLERSSSARRIWFLQLLRAVAVLGVVTDHLLLGAWRDGAIPAFVANVREPELADIQFSRVSDWLFTQGVNFGVMGVGIFLLVSGAVIPVTLDRHSPRQFLIMRVWRILPVWVVGIVIAGVWFLAYAAATDWPLPTYSFTAWWSNAGLVYDFLGQPAINPVSWTLLIYLKFYVLCALFAWANLLRNATAMVSLVVFLNAAAMAGERFVITGPVPVGMMERLAAILSLAAPMMCLTFAGVCVYNRLSGHWTLTKMLGNVSAMVVVMWASFEWAVPQLAYLQRSMAVGGVVFAAAYCLRDRLPHSRVMDWVANISYPIYAVHYVFGIGLMYTVYAAVPIRIVAQVAALLAVFLLAAALHRWVEVPTNTWGRRLAAPLKSRMPTRRQVPER